MNFLTFSCARRVRCNKSKYLVLKFINSYVCVQINIDYAYEKESRVVKVLSEYEYVMSCQ